MLTIRLKPIGRKKRISYRIVVSERRSKLTGKAIDDLGYYNPTVHPVEFIINQEKVKFWKQRGAILSEGIRKLLNENSLKV